MSRTFWPHMVPRAPWGEATDPMKKAVFLDRDGVVKLEKNYVRCVEDFEFVEGIFELRERAQALGFRLFIITNQDGIGRGYYTECDVKRLTGWMRDRFASREIGIERVYHCLFHHSKGAGAYRRECFGRKANPEMILRAQRDCGLNLLKSVVVGGKGFDIEAGRAAGVGCNLRLRQGGCDRSRSAGIRLTSSHPGLADEEFRLACILRRSQHWLSSWHRCRRLTMTTSICDDLRQDTEELLHLPAHTGEAYCHSG